MKNLIDFFDRNRYVLFFLLLQIICFILIAQNNSFQGRAMFNASNSVTGYVYQKKTSVNDYFKLKTINENLSDENALLRTLLHAYNKDNFKKAFEVNDSVYQINYEFSPAKIIDYTFNKTKNYITIDIGSNQGISEDMGLISDKGVIGRIKEVSPNYAVAYSIMHEDFVLSVKHKENGQFGLLQNSNKGINICSINEFPKHVKINIGDSIITRGGKGIFPEGILVGTISDIKEVAGSSFFDVSVKLSTDMTKLNQAYVIISYSKNELDSLYQKAGVN